MAYLWFGHFDSTDEDERELLAEEWARYIRSFITDGIRNGGTCLEITAASGMAVKLDNGVANIQGYIFQCNEDHGGRYYNIDVPSAHPALPRIDRVILRLDRRTEYRKITPEILMGGASASPTPPALTRNNNIWELSLARVRVPSGAINIVPTDITNERFDTDLCGLINSVLGLDPYAWQAQFDAFIAAIESDNTAFIAARVAEWNAAILAQQTTFNNWFNPTKDTYTAWFNSIKINLATYATFDFDNPAAYPGTQTKTTGLDTDTVTETKINASNGRLVAVCNTA